MHQWTLWRSDAAALVGWAKVRFGPKILMVILQFTLTRHSLHHRRSVKWAYFVEEVAVIWGVGRLAALIAILLFRPLC